MTNAIVIHSMLASSVLALTSACTSPDLAPSISDARKVLDASIKDTQRPLATAAKAELQAAEQTAVSKNIAIVSLPSGCLARLNGDLAHAVTDCHVTEHAKPITGPANATQVRLALTAIRDYFAVLEALATTQSPAQIRSGADALVAALNDVSKTRDTRALQGLRTSVERHGPVFSAAAGFFAEQVRIRAMRRVVRKADPVLDDLVRGIQPILLDLGDPIAERRLAVTDAYDKYLASVEDGNANAQMRHAGEFKRAVARMHKDEAASPLRRLYLVRQMHAAMPERLRSGPSTGELEALVSQISEIATLLEKN